MNFKTVSLCSSLVLILVLIQKYAQAGNDRCQRIFPQQGVWSDENPSHWQDNDCPESVHFDHDAIVSCLHGRKVYIVGNSIARGQGFALGRMSTKHGSNIMISRQDQKKLCSKNVTDFRSSKCVLHSDGNVTIHPMTMEFFDGNDYTGTEIIISHRTYS